ncbi:MAG TPA: 4Fe-4S binding protein [Nitrososphaerales archaeon]|nr:4Fe-4S binding protein [Nitrososphaerales archaeon]
MMARKKIGGALGEMFRTALEPPVTEVYPFGRKAVAERFRGRLDIDPVKCTGCSICEIVCPAGVITMVPVGKKTIGSREVDVKRPSFDLYTCISCGQCVDDCRFGALTLTHDFELAVFDKKSLVMKKALKVGK